MKKFLFIVQLFSGLALFLSKYFLALGDSIGWWLSVTGYLLACIYNSRTELKIYALVVFSLALLSAYGGYKWFIDNPGLKLFDYLVISGTIMIAIWMAAKASETKKPLWKHQTIGTIIFMVGFLLIGFKQIEGWYLLLIGHAITGYIYLANPKQKAYVFVVVQAFSAYIALSQIFKAIPIPFAP